MNELYFFGQIVLAVVLGGILGWQREKRGRAAGPRTYALVTAGSTLFTILSLKVFGEDTSRVAAQIVTGIGFLGAGMIIRKNEHIEGLTTAAGLWMAAAIGMAVAAEMYILSVLTTGFILAVFMLNDEKLKGEEPIIKETQEREERREP